MARIPTSARQTLQDVLYGDNGFVERVDKYLAGEVRGWPDGPPLSGEKMEPHTCKVTFVPVADVTPRDVEKWAVTSLAGGQLLAEEVEEHLVSTYGENPAGNLQLRLYPDGFASKPPVNLDRKITTPGLEAATPSADLLLRLYQQEVRRSNYLEEKLLDQHTNMAQALGAAVQANATLATARTAGSAAADMSSPFSILGALIMVAALPSMKKALGLSSEATLQDMLDRLGALAQGSAKRLQEAGAKRGEDPPPPPLLGDDGDPEEEDPETVAPVLEDAVTPGGLGDLDLTDPEVAAAVFAKLSQLQGDPQLLGQAVTAALAGGADPSALQALQGAVGSK